MCSKGCIWGKCQWLLDSLDLDCPDLWAWASLTSHKPLVQSKEPAIISFSLWAVTWVFLWGCCSTGWTWSRKIAQLLHRSLLLRPLQGRLCSPCSWKINLHGFQSSHQCTPALLGWCKVHSSRALTPPANCFSLAARSLCCRHVPKPWPPISFLALLEPNSLFKEWSSYPRNTLVVNEILFFFF